MSISTWTKQNLAGLALVAAGLGALGGLVGCQPQQGKFMGAYENGDFANAAVIARQVADKSDGRDRVLYRLEEGEVCRAAGQFDESNKAFNQADDQIEIFDSKPDVSVSREALAALSNLATLDYKGTCYDRIMMNTYKVINHMQLGNLDNARVEINRVYDRQQEAVEKYQKKIEKADKDLHTNGSGSNNYDVSRAEQDPKVQQGTQPAMADLKDLAPYELYVNPFSEYIKGLYYLNAGADASEREKAVTSFTKLSRMVNNPYVAQDLATAQASANGQPIAPTTYVILESGLAPSLTAIRIDVPIFVGDVPYVGASFPRLHPGRMGPAYIEARTSAGSAQTALVCDMNAVVGREFKNELPLIIAKTLIATAVKAGAAYGINKGTESNGYAHLASIIGTTIYEASTNQADLRIWRTLPAQFQIARIATPADRQVHLILPGGGEAANVQLVPGIVNVIYVKAVQPLGAMAIQQFKLK